MRSKSKKKLNKKRIDRPFEPEILARARKLARAYQLVISEEPELGYIGRTVEMPFVMADGQTIEACAEEVFEATSGAIATLLEVGERPPTPAYEGKRDQQVNIRLSAEEKLRLEEAARREGFRSLSDYLRTSGLNRAS